MRREKKRRYMEEYKQPATQARTSPRLDIDASLAAREYIRRGERFSLVVSRCLRILFAFVSRGCLALSGENERRPREAPSLCMAVSR